MAEKRIEISNEVFDKLCDAVKADGCVYMIRDYETALECGDVLFVRPGIKVLNVSISETEEAHDARLEAEILAIHRERTPFGRLMPDAAMKQVEQWQEDDKRRKAEIKEKEEFRALQLKTPVCLNVGGRLIDIDRLVFEDVMDKLNTGISYIDEDEIIENMLGVLVDAGIIKIL